MTLLGALTIPNQLSVQNLVMGSFLSSIAGSPIYLPGSTLTYESGTLTAGDEWLAGATVVGAGVPENVTIGSFITLPSGAAHAVPDVDAGD